MMTNFTLKTSRYAPIIVRIGMSLVFLCFSFSQFSNPSLWTSYVPDSIVSIFGGNAVLLVLLNAWFELVFGLMLLCGFQVRLASILLGIHLIGISSTFGLSPIGIRDYGLAIATLSIFFAGPDIWSTDRYFLNKNVLPIAAVPADSPIRKI